MTSMTPSHDDNVPQDGRKPGILLQSLQWAAEPVMRLALGEPTLLAHLTDLDACRLHVIAFYLAHRKGDMEDRPDAALLGTARSRDILAKATGQPVGRLLGLLRRLPEQVQGSNTYMRLAALSSNPAMTKLMMRQSKLNRLAIGRLAQVPPELLSESLLRAIGDDIEKLMSISDTAAWLSRRWHIDTIDRFAAVRSLAELQRLASDLIRSLPPVPRLPPKVIGQATMIETAHDLRRAGRAGRNCLGRYARELSRNSGAFYVWRDDDEPIYIRVTRNMELGWFLSDMQLAGNKRPPDHRWQLVDRAFEAAGIDWEAIATNMSDLLLGREDD
jgi:hypothetical protein